NDAQSLAGLGNIALARGDKEKASRHLTEAAKLAPNDALIQGSLANVMLAMNTPDFAIQAANNALALKPDYAMARQVLGKALLSKGDIEGAREAFEALLAQGGQLAAAHLGLGDIARLQERHDEAVAHYEQALQQQPDLPPAAIRRADSLARSGRVDQAIAELREYALAYPDAAYVKVTLASLLDQRDRHAEALPVWRGAAALLPDNGNVQANYALALDRAGDYEAAAQQAQRVPGDPPRPALVLMHARAALREGDAAGVLRRLESLDEAQWEESAQTLRRRWKLAGLAHDALCQWSEAVRAFERAIARTGKRCALARFAIRAADIAGGIAGFGGQAVGGPARGSAPARATARSIHLVTGFHLRAVRRTLAATAGARSAPAAAPLCARAATGGSARRRARDRLASVSGCALAARAETRAAGFAHRAGAERSARCAAELVGLRRQSQIGDARCRDGRTLAEVRTGAPAARCGTVAFLRDRRRTDIDRASGWRVSARARAIPGPGFAHAGCAHPGDADQPCRPAWLVSARAREALR